VGMPIPYQMVKIEDGEILVKGDHVTQGYYKNPEKNKEAFTKDGWYKTGDLAEIREGKIFLTGRAKDRIILSNGVNIYPQDIEFEFNRIDKITDTCVIGIDRGKGEELFAIFLTQLSQSKIESILKKVNKKLSVNQ